MLLAILLLMQLVFFGIFVAWLRLGARWAKVADARWGRILAAAGLIQVVGIVVFVFGRAARDRGDIPEIAISFVELVVGVGAILIVLMLVLRTTLRRALVVWLTSLGSQAIAVAFVFFVMIPYVAEACTNASSAMAPTILGHHLVAACPKCGGSAYVSVEPHQRPGAGPLGPAICGRCLQASEVVTLPAQTGVPDRFIIDQRTSPRRWDVIRYRFPEDPTVMYISRLVGLPGEIVAIKGGSVWINGQSQTPPSPIERLVYQPEPGIAPSATPDDAPERSWTLGPDEYFVLGDFSLRARDSRAWDTGAPGHSPFAVPRSHLAGVAAYIYWPPSRWRRLR
jgi:signal peptidase I